MARAAGCGVTTRPPPPRWRVVEQGRRLVVIDMQTGTPATRPAVPTGKFSLPTAPERTDFSGRATLRTHPIYDDKAPRTLTLDPGAARLIDGVRVCLIGGGVMFAVAAILLPWLVIVPIALLTPQGRSAIRTRVTAWLDRYADTGSSAG